MTASASRFLRASVFLAPHFYVARHARLNSIRLRPFSYDGLNRRLDPGPKFRQLGLKRSCRRPLITDLYFRLFQGVRKGVAFVFGVLCIS